MPKIPEYSEGRGRVPLQGRLAPLPQSTVQAMGAPAQAMAEFSETTRQAVGKYQEVNRRIKLKKDTDDARVWLIENRQKVLQELAIETENLNNQISPESFLIDNSTEGAPNPDAYTSRSLQNLDKILSSDAYTPPNKIAEQAWKEETAKIRGNHTLNSIKYQSQQRVAQIKATLNSSLEDSAVRVMNNPEILFDEINHFDSVTREDNLESIVLPELASNVPYDQVLGGLPKQFLSQFREIANRTLLDAALTGMSTQDPLGAIKSIVEAEFDNGNMYGLSPDTLTRHLNTAASNMKVNVSSTVNLLKERIENHLASKIQGGKGDENFVSQDAAEDFIGNQIFGNVDMEMYEKYLPDQFKVLEEVVDGVLGSLEKQARVVNSTSLIVQTLHGQPLEEMAHVLNTLTELSRQLVQSSELSEGGAAYMDPIKGEYTQKQVEEGSEEYQQSVQDKVDTDSSVVAGDVQVSVVKITMSTTTLPGRESILEAFKGLSTAERAEVLTTVNASLQQHIKDREEDGALYYLRDAGVQSMVKTLVDNGYSQEIATFKALDAAYDNENRETRDRTYLTKEQANAAAVALTDKSQSSDDLINNLQAFQDTYGSYYNEVWRQLSKNEPSIDFRYSFLAATASSYGAQLIATALLTTDEAVAAQFTESNVSDFTYANFKAAAEPEAQKIMHALIGGLSERMNQVAPVKELLIKTMAIAASQGNTTNVNPEDAVEQFLETLNNAAIFQEPVDDKILGFVTDEHKDQSGVSLTSVQENVVANSRAFFNLPESEFKKVIGDMSFNDPLIVYGSPTLSMAGEEGAAQVEEQFYDHIRNNGYFTLDDDGEKMMLIIPGANGINNAPVLYEDEAFGPTPVTFPFDYFTKHAPEKQPGVVGKIMSGQYIFDIPGMVQQFDTQIREKNSRKNQTSPQIDGTTGP